MAIAIGTTQNAVFGVSGGNTTLNTSAATLLIVVLDYYKAGGRNLTDSNSNSWTEVALGVDASTNCASVMYYCENPTVGASHTFYTTSQYCGLTIICVSGEATTSYDVSNGRGGYDASPYTTFQPGSVTPSQNNSLVITSAYQAAPTGAVTTPSGYTSIANWAFGTAYPGGVAYQIQTTATATNPTWGVSATSNVAANIAVFKPLATTTVNSNFFMFM